MTPVLITFEAHGFPVELSNARDIERAIRARQLSSDTIVRVHADDGIVVARRARTVPYLQPFLGIEPASTPDEPIDAPGPALGPPASVVTRSRQIDLRKGQNIPLSAPATGDWMLEIIADCGSGRGSEIDFSAFVLRENGKVGGDDHLIFYNNRTGVAGSVVLLNRTTDAASNVDRFRIDMAAFPTDTRSVVFTASIYGPAGAGNLGTASITLVDPTANDLIARYTHDEEGVETALILAELYRHGGGWKFRAVGQGYADGFRALVERYGVDVGADG